jgi:hypothetical protein
MLISQGSIQEKFQIDQGVVSAPSTFTEAIDESSRSNRLSNNRGSVNGPSPKASLENNGTARLLGNDQNAACTAPRAWHCERVVRGRVMRFLDPSTPSPSSWAGSGRIATFGHEQTRVRSGISGSPRLTKGTGLLPRMTAMTRSKLDSRCVCSP